MRTLNRARTKVSIGGAALVFLTVFASSAGAQDVSEKMLVFRGMSDASAAVSLGDDLFVVGDNETNVLRVYRTDQGERTVFTCDIARFLNVDPDKPETNIEGATRIGDRVYWTTSHGRNKDGKLRSSRYRFFATTVAVDKDAIRLSPVGTPCETLAQQLVRTEALRSLGLDKVTRFDAMDLKKKELRKLAPKEEGLNIEALSASADGRLIYIGFRNPRPPAGPQRTPHALVVPLINPAAVVEAGAPAVFDAPLLWDLGGMGITSMEYSAFHKAYFITAGPRGVGREFALYRWSGVSTEAPVLVRRLQTDNSRFSPEAVVPFPNSAKLLLLSDDGTIPVKVADKSECREGELTADGFCPNKYLIDAARKTFRATWLEP